METVRKRRRALATGGWRDAARLKMASAGMCFDDHPAATADDGLDRESIMTLSVQRAAERYGASFACTVYVGTEFGCSCLSQYWRSVHWYRHRESSDTMSAEGAVRVFPDFSDADIFLSSVYEITNAA